MDLPLVQIEETEIQVEVLEAPLIVVQVLESEIEVSEAEAEVNVAVVNPPPISIEIQEETTQVVEASSEEVIIVEPASVGMQGPAGSVGMQGPPGLNSEEACIHGELHLTPRAAAFHEIEGVVFYASDDDHLYVATE